GHERVGSGLGLSRSATAPGSDHPGHQRGIGGGENMARIVFCEDEEQIRKLIEAAMRSTAHSIELTVNGREGLAAIERKLTELIVTDLAMPEMGGFALADAVHARPGLGHIPIMFVTASVQRGDVAR